MADDWRRAVTFTVRLEHTTEMQVSASVRRHLGMSLLTGCSVTAYKQAHPDCDPGEAKKYAKTSEEAARKNALNLVCHPRPATS